MNTNFAIFDVDGTILSKRSIDVICERYDLTSKLKEIDFNFKDTPKLVVTKKIGQLLSGMNRNELCKIFDSIPLNLGVIELIAFLKERGFIVALATDGYKFLADRLKEKISVDLVYGNILEFDGEILTGRIITIPSCLHISNCQEYLICKLRLLRSLKGALGGMAIAIGDSDSDYCMFDGADISVAYRPKGERIRNVADVVVSDFFNVKKYLETHLT
ncbi:MAG: HAD-IB family phosphatase [Candidatus Bathyarchaeota archaeon]|nr:HAD-IB family phosphatase [Candidatus Bathyarchaeota archaeon]